ncbi:hypothetical protein NX021_26410, partial [Cytobacillus firmus]|nr:hypothetical protein [Cytobacillus firmus]
GGVMMNDAITVRNLKKEFKAYSSRSGLKGAFRDLLTRNYKIVQVQALKDDKKALLTAELLDKVYNGTTPMKTIESHYIREELVKELLNFLNSLQRYYTAGTEELKHYYKLQINEQLHSSSAFTMFKRSIIRDDPSLMREFRESLVNA